MMDLRMTIKVVLPTVSLYSQNGSVSEVLLFKLILVFQRKWMATSLEQSNVTITTLLTLMAVLIPASLILGMPAHQESPLYAITPAETVSKTQQKGVTMGIQLMGMDVHQGVGLREDMTVLW